MSYLDKSITKTDLLFKKLKPSSNLIVFVLKENEYVIYTLSDMKEIIKNTRETRYIEGKEKLQFFFSLPIRIYIDMTLERCFLRKINTMRLVQSDEKFKVGFGENKQVYSFYTVNEMKRSDIGVENEESVFGSETDSDSDSENSEVEIDWKKVEDEKKKREGLEIERIEKEFISSVRELALSAQEQKNLGNYSEKEETEDGIYIRTFRNFDLFSEEWLTSENGYREGQPAYVEYYEDGLVKYEEYWDDAMLYRPHSDKPAEIFFYNETDEKGHQLVQKEQWYSFGELHKAKEYYKELDEVGSQRLKREESYDAFESLSSVKEYYKNGRLAKKENWQWGKMINGDDGKAYTSYYENGVIATEKWMNEGGLHRLGLPAFISYFENCKFKEKKWFNNGDLHRNEDEPAVIVYNNDETNSVCREEWFEHDLRHRNNNKPACIEYYNKPLVKCEKWFKNNLSFRKRDLPVEIYYYKSGNIKKEEWKKNNLLHREGKPAQIYYFDACEKIVNHEIWRKDGLIHRDKYNNYDHRNKSIVEEPYFPAHTTYFLNKSKATEKWFDNGILHRDNDEPAEIQYYENENKIKEKKWFLNNRLIRLTGLPAEIHYYENGSLKTEKWFINDILVRINQY